MRPQLPALAALCLVTALIASPAAAAPTCPDPLSRPACGGRVVAEPEQTTTFHQFDGPVESAGASLKAIEARSPGFLEVKTLAEWTGHPEDKSFGGRPLWVARVTDERVPQSAKRQAAASLSVHATEPAGREGGFRYLEDLALWSAALPGTDRTLYSGDVGVPLSKVLAETELWLGFTNSDGWSAGDAGNGTFTRENDNGADLNRDFATVGWFDRTGGRGLAESEPEIKGWTRLVNTFPRLTTSTDIHGELTTPNDAFADLIIPAGQWTPKRQEQVDQLSKHMIRSIDRKFADAGVVLADLLANAPADGSTPRRAANVAASYDIVGYDDSGFMGDWFSQRQDSVHMDIENFLSHMAPGNAWEGTFEEAHVAAVRGILESVLVESQITEAVTPQLRMARVAYVDDAFRTSSDPSVDDGVPGTGFSLVAGESQVPYDVSRLEYFEVLERTIGRPVDAVAADAIAAGADLSGYDSIVLADLPNGVPRTGSVDRAAYIQALREFAAAGGQLVLTDRSLSLLDELGIGTPADQTVNKTDAGHVTFASPLGDHPYEAGLVGAPSQTWYEVMLGYPSRGQAPNYGIKRTVWEGAGGTTVATIGAQGSSSTPNTALGSIPRGKGRIVVFGSVLPQAVENLPGITTPHPYGLADYAVTITGGQVLDNVLAFSREGTEPVVPEVPVAALLPLLAVAVLGVLIQRRRRTA